MGLIRRSAAWQLAELDRILNDPTAPLEPHRVWSLLDDLAATGLSDVPADAGRSVQGCVES